jgi:mannitol operon repressor
MSDLPPRPSFEETLPRLKEFTDFLPTMNKESERGVVLICCSFIDELLRRVLLAFLVDDKKHVTLIDGFNAPLGTFAARIRAASALGLLAPDEAAECDLLRKVRNFFSHEVRVSFEDDAIVKLCDKLRYAMTDYEHKILWPRTQFISAATALILRLVNRPHEVGLIRRQVTHWQAAARPGAK